MALEILEILIRISGFYELSLVILGPILNILTCLICLRKKLRAVSTFQLIAVISIADAFSLAWGWNLNTGGKAARLFNLDSGIHLAVCRTYMFNMLTCTYLSSWLWVVLTAVRYLSIKSRRWQLYFTGKKVIVCVATLTVICILLNGHILFVFGYEFTVINGTQYLNGSDRFVCHFTPFMNLEYRTIMNTVHVISYALVPSVLLTLFNAYLIYYVVTEKRKRGSQQSNADKERLIKMTITVIILTLAFIFSTVVSGVKSIFYVRMLAFNWGMLVASICEGIYASFQSFQFIILFVTNSQFKIECLSMLGKKNEQGTTVAPTAKSKVRATTNHTTKF